ncbi:hypothetical protein R1flu_024506 [Riccia fluitans]|uniref:Uncharacterized protein n=1 Tax=Riccia fluitans TaxID=41844 RepID=A0ABD1XV38_9MARC
MRGSSLFLPCSCHPKTIMTHDPKFRTSPLTEFICPQKLLKRFLNKYKRCVERLTSSSVRVMRTGYQAPLSKSFGSKLIAIVRGFVRTDQSPCLYLCDRWWSRRLKRLREIVIANHICLYNQS